MRKSSTCMMLWGGGLLLLLATGLLSLQAFPVAAKPNDPTVPLINEFVFNHDGVDSHEFIELWGDADTDYSAYTILVVEGDGSAPGEIDNVFTVSTTNSSGYWTTGFLAGDLENTTSTILLVSEFVGQPGEDLDVDDDGLLDANPPWTAVVDDVAVHNGDSDGLAYSTVVLTPNPGGASRIPDHIDTDSVGDWLENDFDGEGLPGFVGTPEVGEALNTPGAMNQEPGTAELVINEIDYDQPGADTQEFIEIKNNSPITVNLDIYSIELINGALGGANVYGTINLPPFHIAPGGYFVACSGDEADQVYNCDFEFGSSIQNGNLSDTTNLNSPDAIALIFDDTIVDTVSYEGDVSGYTEDVGVPWPADTQAGQDGISRIIDGQDTDHNQDDFAQRCITPGFANSAQTTDCEALLDPAMSVSLTAVPDTVVDPGGTIMFDLWLTNTGAVSLTVTSLTESVLGSLDEEGDCVLPIVLEMAQGYACQYSDDVSGTAGQQFNRSVTAVGVDKNGIEAQAMADETITITNESGPDEFAIYLPAVMKPFTFGEPNNACETAYEISLNDPAAFFAEDVYDWYIFDLHTTASVQIELINFVPAAGQMLVYSGNCNGLVTVAHDGALTVDNLLDLGTLSSGQYFVWIINDGALNSTDLYELTVHTQ